MWLGTHPFKKKEVKGFFLVLFFLLLSSLSPLSKVDAATIHSSEQGGLWNYNSTWVGEVIPTENDDVVIDSRVDVRYQQEEYARNVSITQNGMLLAQYNYGTLHAHNVHNEGVVKRINLYIDGVLENDGEINTSSIRFSGETLHNTGVFIRQENWMISDIAFYGTNPKTIQGIGDEDVTVSLMDDLYVRELTLFPNIHTRGNVVHGDIELHGHGRNWTSNESTIDGILYLVNTVQSFAENLSAQKIYLKTGSSLILNKGKSHLHGNIVMEEGSSLSSLWYGGNVHIHDKLKAVGNANMSASSMLHFYDDVDFHGTIQSYFVTIANENKEGTHYFYEYVLNGYQGTIDGEESYDRIASVRDENGNNIPLKDILLDRTQVFKWRTRADDDPWGPWHYFNNSRYLEENTHFFTTSVNDVTEGEAQEIVIRAEDDAFSGDVQLSVDEGAVSPSVVHMENGEVSVPVTFDTPQEHAILSLQSAEHPLLTGTSSPFNVLHAIREHFFTMPPVTEARVGETLAIPLHAEDADYEGDVEIVFSDGNGGEEVLPTVHMQGGFAAFQYVPREVTQNASFRFRDVERDWLRGESIPFVIYPEKKRHRISSRRIIPNVNLHIVGETFITQGESGDEGGEESGEQEDTSPPQDEESESDEDGNNEEQDEPHYLLENSCLDIHSELPVLKKWTSDHENTKKLQDFLIAKHYLTPPPDGIFGNQTKTALKNFQQDHKLTPDGIFGQGSSHFIDVHCGSIPMREELQEDEEDTQQEDQNDEVDEEQSEQDEQGNDDTWIDAVKDWFAGSWNNIMDALGFSKHNEEDVFNQVVDIVEQQEQEEENEEIKIITFSSDRFIGKELLFEESFLPSIQKLEQFARDSHIKIFITQSLRNPSDTLTNTVVTPSKKSNHYVGHAIDMNIKLDSGEFCNGSCIERGDYEEVNNFLNLIRNDETLRWGGDFSDVDPVHIDDGLNIRKPQEWLRIFTKISYNELYD